MLGDERKLLDGTIACASGSRNPLARFETVLYCLTT